MSHGQLLPVVALVAWTFVMWIWMYATRIPAIRRAKMQLDPTATRGSQMATLPPEVRWKADNYNHLHEQPMLFYAITIVQYLVDPANTTSIALAWIYVGLRVVHSVWQALRNVIEIRFALFLVSSLVLLVSTIRLGASML